MYDSYGILVTGLIYGLTGKAAQLVSKASFDELNKQFIGNLGEILSKKDVTWDEFIEWQDNNHADHVNIINFGKPRI